MTRTKSENGTRNKEEAVDAHGTSRSLQPSNTPILHFTDSAVRQLKHLRAKKGDESLGVRVGVKGGGCSGLSYFLKFEPAPKENDVVLEVDSNSNDPTTQRPNGLRAWLDPKSARFIAGTTVDFSLSNFLEGGFKFENPNAAKSCGCGTSFTPRIVSE